MILLRILLAAETFAAQTVPRNDLDSEGAVLLWKIKLRSHEAQSAR
jgi:hypothetical protein